MHLYDILHCQICLELGTLELTRIRRVLDSKLARNVGHWNRNWLGIGLGGLEYSPENHRLIAKRDCNIKA